MKKQILALVLSTAFALPAIAQKKKKNAPQQQKTEKLELQQIWASPTFYAKGLYDLRQMPGADQYIRQWSNTNTGAIALLKYAYEGDAAPDTIFSQATAKGLPEGFIMEDYKISPNGNYILLQTNSNAIYRHSSQAQFYIYSVRVKRAKPVAGAKQVMLATISPDEEKVAYVQDNNIYYQNFKTDQVTQVTKDGEYNKIINGKTDWVYEEEFAFTKAFEWSPNGDKLAYLRFDESKVKLYQLAVYDSLYPTQHLYKYPKAGEDNSVVSVWAYLLSSKNASKLAETKPGEDEYLPRFKWIDNDRLSYQLLNRNQNNLRMYAAAGHNSAGRQLIYEETSPTYVDVTDNLHFLNDGSFFITSERDGYNQLFHYSSTGEMIKKLTHENYDIDNILGVDKINRVLYFSSFEPSPSKKTIFKIDFDGNNKRPLVDGQTGRGSASFSAGYKYFVFSQSNSIQPPVWGIYNSAGNLVRTMEDNAALQQKVSSYNTGRKEFMEISLGDGVVLSAWIIKPKDFDKKKKYPLLFSIYGGPGHQMVTDQWGGPMDMWYQYLADKGYIVVSVDNRGTGGKGAEFKKSTYKKLGQLESDDQIAAARYFARLPYIDPSRIGIYGWSFGGYMSAMCLMKGNDVFKMAVSVAPVTDWRYYDNIYSSANTSQASLF